MCVLGPIHGTPDVSLFGACRGVGSGGVHVVDADVAAAACEAATGESAPESWGNAVDLCHGGEPRGPKLGSPEHKEGEEPTG